MDNLCHSLVGLAAGRAGLSGRTGLATATLVVAANLPDLDVLVLATDLPSVAFRRGWTHGVLAQALLPVALTLVVLAVARMRRARPDAPPVRPRWILLLSCIGVWSHVGLDYLNTYGIRLLAPLDWRWFYGDAVFIIDPWLWAALGAGIWVSRRRRSPRPAAIGLAAAGAYVLAMLVSAQLARDVVANAWRDKAGREPAAMMVGPVPLSPFERQIVVDAGSYYQTGTLTWWPTRVVFDGGAVAKNDRDSVVAVARSLHPLQGFLVWSRFPYFDVTREPSGTRVSAADMRFTNMPRVPQALARGRGSASVVIVEGAGRRGGARGHFD